MSDLFPPTLDEALAELSRELQKRREVFPRWVADGRIKQDVADQRIRTMQHAYDLLMGQKYAAHVRLVDGAEICRAQGVTWTRKAPSA